MTNATLIETQTSSAIGCPTGFLAAGLACGIKASGADDLALILCPSGANAAAVFTTNLVKAAPVVISQRNISQARGKLRALIINSGCANAATGAEGFRRAERVMDALAMHLGCARHEVLMNSTGVIGEQLSDDLITAALPDLIEACAEDGLIRAAGAIHTTDTRLKMTQQIVKHASPSSVGRASVPATCRVVGIAKGAGMIHPNMATTIGVIMTDAHAEPAALDSLLRDAVERSFHRITVDGDTSTNDAVLLLASGTAGPVPHELLAPAINQVARDLAEMVVRDGEGASKLIRVRVTGARSQKDALQVAKTIASSLLVRTSVAGGDPNWGRILCAAGYSGINFDPERITLRVNDLLLYDDGRPAETPKRALERAYAADEVTLDIDLHQGEASEEFLTCDLTEQYVRVNAEYTS